MKEGWEYKKLGEVCDIINGKNQRAVENPDGNYPIMGSGGIMGYADDYLCKEGTTIIGRKGTINRPIYVETKFWNVDTAFGLQPKDKTNSKFLFYLCKSINFERYNKSVTIPSLVKSDLLKIDIRFPKINEEQQQIVSELDLLSGVIEKQKAQLEELDKLAQSIFYDMFEKKDWESKKIKDIAIVKIGPFGSALHQHDYISGGTPLVNPIHMKNGKIEADSNFTISDEKKKELSSYLLKINDIVFGRRGDIGRCALVTQKENGFLCGTGSLFVRFTININPLYSLKLLSSSSVKQYLLGNARGATMLNLNSTVIEGISIPLPPLSLQQEFAAKIEAIEAMKTKVRQSIKEAETLFNERMDYYFN